MNNWIENKKVESMWGMGTSGAERREGESEGGSERIERGEKREREEKSKAEEKEVGKEVNHRGKRP